MKLSDMTVDPLAIETGEWVDNIPDCYDLRIKARGLNNQDYKRMQQRLLRNASRADRMPDRWSDTLDLVQTKCLAETCLIDIENFVHPDGKPVTVAEAKTLILEPKYRPVRDAVLYAASLIGQAKADDLADAAKN